MKEKIPALFGSRWAGWVVGAIAVLILLFHPRVIRKTIHDVTTVEHWSTKFVDSGHVKVVGGPGSKTTVYPDGHYVIEGPSTLDLTYSHTGEIRGDRTTKEHNEEILKPADRQFGITGGLMIGRPYLEPAPRYWGVIDYRVVGPFSVALSGVYDPVRVDASIGAGIRLEF